MSKQICDPIGPVEYDDTDEYVNGTMGLEVIINSAEAFDLVNTTWPSAGPFVLITYSDGCIGTGSTTDGYQASSNNTRTYWLVEDPTTMTATSGFMGGEIRIILLAQFVRP